MCDAIATLAGGSRPPRVSLPFSLPVGLPVARMLAAVLAATLRRVTLFVHRAVMVVMMVMVLAVFGPATISIPIPIPVPGHQVAGLSVCAQTRHRRISTVTKFCLYSR